MTRFTFINIAQVANNLNKNSDNHKNRMSNDSTTSYSLESNSSSLSDDDDCNVFGDYFDYSERRTLSIKHAPNQIKKVRRVTFAPTTRVISIPPRGHYKDLLSILYYTKDEYDSFASEAAHEIRAFSDSPECRRKYRQLLTLGMLTHDEHMTPLNYTESHSTPSSSDKTNTESDSHLSSPTSYASSSLTTLTNTHHGEMEKRPEFRPLSKAISILYQPWPVFDDHYMTC